MEELPPGMIVIYRARSWTRWSSADELEWLAEQRARDALVRPRRRATTPGRGGRSPPAGMREIVPDVRRRDVYLCGPPGVVDATMAALKRLRVPRRQIHMDPFEF